MDIEKNIFHPWQVVTKRQRMSQNNGYYWRVPVFTVIQDTDLAVSDTVTIISESGPSREPEVRQMISGQLNQSKWMF